MTTTIPDGQVVYAIGDIHGRSDLLTELLALIESDAAAAGTAAKTLVFLGDYVDRGPDSRGVIELLSADLPPGFDTHFLKGNHEQFLLDFLDDPSSLDGWLRNGGEQTLRSYGVDIDGLQDRHAPPMAWREAFLEALPEAHLRFLTTLELKCVVGDYVFVHAGLRPGVPLDRQVPQDLLWIRHEFLDSEEPFGKIVVHGHTPERTPVVRPNRIGIDTGAVFSGSLTALRLENGTRAFLRTAP
ncbi:metallophosphoesterase family protein [Methyloceanibacter sp. wino2]|uniref:metallophosphoesterase family protein n=1 Tax=Methyloceanibacter sp. wino2 TaxID=2170729 RepID=UPI000D3ECF30|nr:metallophosphoesterase family protein [Methyloceanibacter sp. wino2]